MKKGHSVKDCKFRWFLVPKGLVRWVPKSTSNSAGPKFNRVPMPQFSVLQVCLASSKLIWYLDSGCSKHMIGDSTQLINIKWKPAGYVTYGDNN